MELVVVKGIEPYTVDYLICVRCDSTYAITEEEVLALSKELNKVKGYDNRLWGLHLRPSWYRILCDILSKLKGRS